MSGEATASVPRSSELMKRDDTALLIVDVQQRLLQAIPDSERLVWNIRRLVDAAQLLGVPVFATEQYPRGLGPTDPLLAERLGEIPDKLAFSCAGCGDLFARIAAKGRHRVLVAGIETHVCVQQTVLDLMHDGFRSYIAVDAVASRFPLDRQIALQRMESSGATLTTAEAVLFEWCEVAGTPQFKRISQLARETPPA